MRFLAKTYTDNSGDKNKNSLHCDGRKEERTTARDGALTRTKGNDGTVDSVTSIGSCKIGSGHEPRTTGGGETRVFVPDDRTSGMSVSTPFPSDTFVGCFV